MDKFTSTKKLLGSIASVYLMLSSFSMESFAQNIEYELVYNTATCYYEAHAHVVGTNRVFPNTIPFPSQYTIVVPNTVAAVPMSVTEHVNPPGKTWNNSNNAYAPSANPANDYHTFTTDGGSGSNAYSSFVVGDDIHLFSFTLPPGSCGSGIRLYINGTDPDSNAPGMMGIDHTQSFKVFPNIEVYGQNRSDAALTVEEPVPDPSTATCDAVDVSLTASAPNQACFSVSSYSWSGPNSFTSTEQNPIFSLDADPNLQAGLYIVTITADNGCTAVQMITLNGANCAAFNCGAADNGTLISGN